MPGIEIKKREIDNKDPKQKNSKGFLDGIDKLLSKEISFRKSFTNRKKYKFYNDLDILISAGIDLKTGMELLVDNFTKKEDRKVIQMIHDKLIGGAGFCDAVGETGKFSVYEYYSLKIGEETGKLTNVLNDLAQYFKKRIEQNRKIINAFTYPIIVVLTAIVAVVFMMNFIVPMFEEVFQRFDRELPGLTKTIIGISNFLSGYSWLFLFVLIALVLTLYLLRKNEVYKRIVSNMVLRIPVFGDLIRKMHLARFCLSMELLIGSRTPLLNAIQLVKKMITYYPVKSSLDHIEEDILRGIPLHQSMAKYGVYDKSMISLIKIAEEVNKLDVIFSKLKDQYQDEVDYRAGMISNIMEPLMIVFIGLFVGLVLISMYLPIFQMSTSFEF